MEKESKTEKNTENNTILELIEYFKKYLEFKERDSKNQAVFYSGKIMDSTGNISYGTEVREFAKSLIKLRDRLSLFENSMDEENMERLSEIIENLTSFLNSKELRKEGEYFKTLKQDKENQKLKAKQDKNHVAFKIIFPFLASEQSEKSPVEKKVKKRISSSNKIDETAYLRQLKWAFKKNNLERELLQANSEKKAVIAKYLAQTSIKNAQLQNKYGGVRKRRRGLISRKGFLQTLVGVIFRSRRKPNLPTMDEQAFRKKLERFLQSKTQALRK